MNRDFARLRETGFDSVRIFLLWEDFQPAPDRVSEQALTRLVRVADADHDNNLSLIPTLFTGHMSGVNWIPHWAVDAESHPGSFSPEARFRIVADNQAIPGIAKNWFSDETVGNAQERFAGAAAGALRGHPALWAWDLGNENSNCCIPPTRRAAVAWLKRMSTRIRSADPKVAITIGLHMEDLIEDRRLGPQEAGPFCDFLCMHGYPIYAEFAESPTDERLLPFLGLITSWLGRRKVLLAECGAPALRAGTLLEQARFASPESTLLDEDSAATFSRRALDAPHRFGFLGAMLWCYGDYAEHPWTPDTSRDTSPAFEKTAGSTRTPRSVAAFAMLGEGGKAVELFNLLSPIHLTYRHGATLYRITVENPKGVCRGVDRTSLDGALLSKEALVPLCDDGSEHRVQALLG